MIKYILQPKGRHVYMVFIWKIIKEDVTTIYEELGMDLPAAICIFLKRFVQGSAQPPVDFLGQ